MEIDALPSQKKRFKPGPIIGGCFLILLGLGFGYFFIYRKLEEMKLQQDFTYSMKGMMIVPLCIVFGFYYIIFKPAGAGAWKDLTKREKPFFIAALLLSLLSFAGLAYWFSHQLTANGYAPIF
ncbi:MAG: hypothetical protein ABIQ88_16435 [Chitinophagaceae bacterium]